jgi:hypothetical protein
VADAVQPKIEELAKELGLDTASTTVISVRGEDVATLGPESATWRIRLIVRHAFDKARENFQAHVGVAKDSRTGFSGFAMTGTASHDADGFTIRPKSWTGLYNAEPAKDWR